jgi:flagellar basal-body rod modification protein FlgD
VTYSQISDTITQLNNNTNQVRYQNGRDNLGKTELSKDAFMQLMLAQLQHQDPIDPMSNEQFLQQQAAFTQIEKLNNLNSTMTSFNGIMQAGSMVGKYVEITTEKGEKILGKVESATIGTSGVQVKVNNQLYNTSSVSQILSELPAAS